ncbi:FtsX-like permease family protein [Candidatus Falkowbacteria bacterium]|nr:FtsX-like permease family protein [Candidatus Falkowbacteria bacterium]
MISFNDTIKLATRMFRTRPMRTWLTILGIGVGISAVVILVGLGYGLQKILLEKIVFGEAMLSLDVVTPPSQVLVIDDEKIQEFRQVPAVDDVSPLATFNSSITFENLTGSVMIRGVEPSYFGYAGVRLSEGEFFEKGEKNKVILSSAILKLFEMEPADVMGKAVNFKVIVPAKDGTTREVPLNKQYYVKGIVEDETSLYVYASLEDMSSQFVIPFYERARVKVTTSDDIDPTEAIFLEKGFLVNSLSKTVEQANKIFQGVQVTLAIFGGIALIVSAIGMFNTMTVTLLERTKEIGIMRTIGASNLTIMILFLSEALLMGFFGGLSGVAIGVISGTSANFLLSAVASRMGGQPIDIFSFPIFFLVFMIIFSAFLGVLTGFFPSRRASTLNPLDAIRYS